MIINADVSEWVKRAGIWRKDFRKHLQASTEKEVQRYADDVRRTVQRKIRGGEVGGKPLSKEWIKDKKRRKMKTKKLMETQEMVKHVNVSAGTRTEGGAEGIVFGVGMIDGSSLRKAPKYLPIIHEKGSKGVHRVPKRPVWVRAAIETRATSPAYRRMQRGKWWSMRGANRALLGEVP